MSDITVSLTLTLEAQKDYHDRTLHREATLPIPPFVGMRLWLDDDGAQFTIIDVTWWPRRKKLICGVDCDCDMPNTEGDIDRMAEGFIKDGWIDDRDLARMERTKPTPPPE